MPLPYKSLSTFSLNCSNRLPIKQARHKGVDISEGHRTPDIEGRHFFTSSLDRLSLINMGEVPKEEGEEHKVYRSPGRSPPSSHSWRITCGNHMNSITSFFNEIKRLLAFTDKEQQCKLQESHGELVELLTEKLVEFTWFARWAGRRGKNTRFTGPRGGEGRGGRIKVDK